MPSIEEIVAKDQAIVKEHFEFQRSEKLKENVMSELNRKNLMIQSNHDLIHQQVTFTYTVQYRTNMYVCITYINNTTLT